MSDTETYIRKLEEFLPLRESVLLAAIQSLNLPQASNGLDVGCGVGCVTKMLAEEVGADGHVSGLDLSKRFVQYATKKYQQHPFSANMSYQQGSVEQIPFKADSFDWIWSCDCVGYPAGRLDSLLIELKRVLKPGGQLALLGWTSQHVLPGHTMLEASLNATCSGYANILKNVPPQNHFQRALGHFHQNGFREAGVETFTGTVYASLQEDIVTALVSLLDMLWGTRLPKVKEEDWSEFQKLCSPGSPDFILHQPDFYGHFSYTMFHARK